MCGIAGAAWADPNRVTAPGLVAQMTAMLAHRGPDGAGLREGPGCSLGHRRLSVIDLEGGRQPLSNEDGTIWVAFNGEIYDYQELQRDLEARGHRFKTKSDTETLVHLYEERGERMVEGLRGMFAFAIWDEPRRRLFVARDPLGKKPFVYRLDEEGFRFASELKALAIEPGFPRDLDPAALDDYLMYQYVPHPRTIFKAVRKLPPGHYGVYEKGSWRTERYWRAPFETERKIGEQEAIAELRTKLAAAVKRRTVADVPLGAFLSGGIDSTITVGLLQQFASEPVRTFSIGFPVKAFDETEYALAAAAHLGTRHQVFRVEPDAVSVAAKLAWHYDEPFADSSAVPTWYVSEHTRREVTVAITGDGGDELFCGYPRYLAMRIGERFDKLPAPLRRLAAARMWQKIPVPARQKSRRRRAQKLLRVLNDPAIQRYRSWVSIFDGPARRAIYR
ncbi:MAG TPA: asparagine synthase (glutamine-hydrolyzing), partial [Planctomycetia bacterium]|nr:asparagine synthase (glutamine-hydrolyzing) [Planctomycetia bacterium]